MNLGTLQARDICLYISCTHEEADLQLDEAIESLQRTTAEYADSIAADVSTTYAHMHTLYIYIHTLDNAHNTLAPGLNLRRKHTL